MEKFFKYLYAILGNKAFKICLVLAIIISFFCFHYRGNFNKEKFTDTIELVKQNTKQKEIEKKYKIDSNVIKKQITKDINDTDIDNKKELTEEQKKEMQVIKNRLKKIDNIFLKLKELEKEYNKKLTNNKINYNRVIKKGDAIYFSLQTIFETNNNSNNNQPASPMKMFTIAGGNDTISKKLIGKKIGEKIIFNYDDFLAGMGEGEKQQVKQAMKDSINNTVKKYNVNKNIIKNYEIKYEMIPLDFISKNIIEELNLTKDN